MPFVTIDKSQVTIYSFGDGYTNKPTCRYLVDLNGVRDPLGQADFRVSFDHGYQPAVAEWIGADDRIQATVHACRMIVATELDIKRVKDGAMPAYGTMGYCTIGLTDKLGKWISPAVALLVASALDKDGVSVSVVNLSLGAK